MLCIVKAWVGDFPPLVQPMRFGNKVPWLLGVSDRVGQHMECLGSPPSLPFQSLRPPSSSRCCVRRFASGTSAWTHAQKRVFG
eukprot:5791926-Amphidinium_carterae.1